MKKRRKEKKEKKEHKERENQEKENEEKEVKEREGENSIEVKQENENRQEKEKENSVENLKEEQKESEQRRMEATGLSSPESAPIFLQKLNFQHLFGTVITCVGFIYSGVLIRRGQIAIFSFVYFMLTFMANSLLLWGQWSRNHWVQSIEKRMAGWRDSLFIFLPSELCLNALLAWDSDIEDVIAPFLLVVMDTFLFPKHFKYGSGMSFTHVIRSRPLFDLLAIFMHEVALIWVFKVHKHTRFNDTLEYSPSSLLYLYFICGSKFVLCHKSGSQSQSLNL